MNSNDPTALDQRLFLDQRLLRALRSLNPSVSSTATGPLWRQVQRRYSEPHRHYHTLTHIERMFSEFDVISDCLDRPYLVALAIFYHDVIYEPQRSDNEAQSADFMQSELQSYLTAEQVEQIKALIMMTASHKLAEVDGIQASDAAYFLDLDLCILGAPWDEYQHYAKAVRLEYRHVSKADYQAGRTAVLQSLLAHDRLYISDDYYERLESVARDNIRREIEVLVT